MIGESIILLLLAIASIALVLLLAATLLTANRNKYPRNRSIGFTERLNYAFLVEDGILAHKDGALSASWVYTAPDRESCTNVELNAAKNRLNQLFSKLGSGWVFHIDAVRKPIQHYPPPSASAFPDPITAAIDEERRRHFESQDTMFEGEFVLTATWICPRLATQQFKALLYDDTRKAQSAEDHHFALIRDFKKQLDDLENKLSMVFNLRRLKSFPEIQEDGSTLLFDEMLGHLQSCITGTHNRVVLPQTPIYLDALLGGRELWGGAVPMLGDKYIQTVSIEGLPLESYPGILKDLSEVAIPVRWSTRFIFLDAMEAEKLMGKVRDKWAQKKTPMLQKLLDPKNPNPEIDGDAAKMELSAKQCIDDIKGGLTSVGYWTSAVVLMDNDRDRLEEASRRIVKLIEQRGFTSRLETDNTVDVFMGTLPGHSVENVRRPLINTNNLADFLPTSSIWAGSETCPCPDYPPNSPPVMFTEAKGFTPFRLNLHYSDTGHTLLFGPTGAGKSTLIATLIAQQRRYPNMRIFAFDKGLSLFPLASAINAFDRSSGRHFEIGGDNSLSFCPLQYLDTEDDLAWAAKWLGDIFVLNNITLTPDYRNLIESALKTMKASGSRNLAEFSILMQDKALREVLRSYTIGGAAGRLFDAKEDALKLSDFSVFEIESLMKMEERFTLPILHYLFRRIEKSLDGSPTAIYIDEAKDALSHPVFSARIETWLAELRKKNCLVFLATQSIGHAKQSSILPMLMESTVGRIFLANPVAKSSAIIDLYKILELNIAQINIIATAREKREYYYAGRAGRRLFSLALGPLTLAFVGVSDTKSITSIKLLMDKHRDLDGHPTPSWVHEYLAQKNLSLSNYITS